MKLKNAIAAMEKAGLVVEVGPRQDDGRVAAVGRVGGEGGWWVRVEVEAAGEDAPEQFLQAVYVGGPGFGEGVAEVGYSRLAPALSDLAAAMASMTETVSAPSADEPPVVDEDAKAELSEAELKAAATTPVRYVSNAAMPRPATVEVPVSLLAGICDAAGINYDALGGDPAAVGRAVQNAIGGDRHALKSARREAAALSARLSELAAIDAARRGGDVGSVALVSLVIPAQDVPLVGRMLRRGYMARDPGQHRPAPDQLAAAARLVASSPELAPHLSDVVSRDLAR